MKFQDNAKLITFLLGSSVESSITTDLGVEYLFLNIKIPTIETLFCDIRFQTILGILNTKAEKLKDYFKFAADITHFRLFSTIKSLKNPIFQKYIDYLVYSFNKLGIGLTVTNELKINNLPINEEIFEYLRKLILFISKMIDSNERAIDNAQYQAAQDLINKIKNQNKNGANQSENSKNFEKNLISILYQYNLDFNKIKDLNSYQFDTLLKYYTGAVGQEINTVAAGNGLTKKIKTISQGGKTK